MGDDLFRLERAETSGKFLSTSPVWGTTQLVYHLTPQQYGFLSTSPVWGTTSAHSASWPACRRFLSTSPVWGTTDTRRRTSWNLKYFYPRPPCGGRHKAALRVSDAVHFYPRPPCGGRPEFRAVLVVAAPGFLSTSPVWGTTRGRRPHLIDLHISIHVPRVGDDSCPKFEDYSP